MCAMALPVLKAEKNACNKQAYAGVDCLMIFTQAEIEVLALCGRCKDLSADGTGIIPAEITDELIERKLLRRSKSGLSFRVTDYGYTLLKSAGFELEPEKYYRGRGAALERRLQTARVTSFFWRFGAGMYCNGAEEKSSNSFLPSFELRRKSASNILGGTRMTGFYYTDSFTFVPYFIAPDNEGLYADVEIRTFCTELLSGGKTPFVIYTGSGSLNDILPLITEKRDRKPKNTTDEYLAAMEKFGKYCAIMPLDKNGYRQLRILSFAGYREKLSRIILGKSFAAADNPASDGRIKSTGEDIIIGFDCNISRYEKLLKSTKKKTHIFLLSFQIEAVQQLFKGQSAILHPLDTAEVERALNIPAEIPKVSNRPFITAKGEYLDVSVVRQAQKA